MIRLFSILVLLLSFHTHLPGQNHRIQDSLKLGIVSDSMYNYNDEQKFDSAIIYANRVVVLTYDLYGKSRQYAVSLNNLGYLYGQNFDYVNAESFIGKAFETLEGLAGENDSDYAAFTNNLAIVYDNLGNYASAATLYTKATSIRKIVFGAQSEEFAAGLNNLGNLYRKMDNYDSAKIFLENSLRIREKSKDYLYAQTLNTLGLIVQKIGNYSSAETQYKEALFIIDSCCGGLQLNEYWDVKNNLASLYFEMSNYKAAEVIHKQVLEHILNKFHKKIVDYATTLGLLANDYNAAEEYDSALYFLKDASGILLNELSANHPDYATNLNVIASTYEKKGFADSSKKYYDIVLEIRRKNFGTNTPIYAETLNNLGRLYVEQKNFEIAEEYFKQSSRITLATLGKFHPAYAESINNLLGLYYSSHDYKKWAGLLNSAIDTWKNSITRLLLSFGEKAKQIYLDNHLSQRDLFLSMLWYFRPRQGIDSFYTVYFKMVSALQGWLLSGSRELNNMVFQKKDSSLVITYNNWLSIKNKYNQAILLSNQQQEAFHLNTDSLMVVAEDLEKSIIGKLPELQASLNNTTIAPSQIAKTLRENDVLINWVSFRYKNPNSWTDSILYAAFVISRNDTSAKFIATFEQTQLKTLLNNYFNYSGRGIVVKRNKTNWNIGNELYRLVWQPVLACTKNATNVFIIPSGLLNKVSFQSMEDTFHNTLLETTRVHLLNNVNELYGGNSQLISKSISLFGGADFDNSSSGVVINADSDRVWKYLSGSADEVNDLKALFKGNHWKTKTYLDVEASEENFKALSGNKSPEIIHVASHGFYTPAETFKSKSNEGENHPDFPLRRSGFLLSGANIYWKNDTASINHEDGIVTAQEISNLNFSNTKLLTLSACETALGDINNNEGVYGLQRAFKIAGVRNMLITLWEIPDKETRELMSLFYQNMLKGNSYYEALQQAQLSIKKKYPDPAIWAAFELIGE